jgi:protein-disulfide isomerase
MRIWLASVLGLSLAAAAVLADDTVATVGSKAITRAELEKHVKAKLIQLENQRFEALKEGLDELVATELYTQEAKARGLSVEELAKKEVESKATEPTEEQIKRVYEENKEELEGQPIDAVKPQIVQYLKQQQLAEANEKFIEQLRKKYKTTVALAPPVVSVSDGGRAARGNASAPVTIIEFSDYECPFCKRANATTEQVLKAYGDKIRFVHRDFPLAFHASARPAAEAALCAGDQGKFWEYQDKLFKSEDLSADKLKALAKETGIDQAKFDDCVAKKPHAATIDKDMADGAEAGVNGTPAFFINGRMISGALPFEKFKEIIDDEIARAGKKS